MRSRYYFEDYLVNTKSEKGDFNQLHSLNFHPAVLFDDYGGILG